MGLRTHRDRRTASHRAGNWPRGMGKQYCCEVDDPTLRSATRDMKEEKVVGREHQN